MHLSSVLLRKHALLCAVLALPSLAACSSGLERVGERERITLGQAGANGGGGEGGGSAGEGGDPEPPVIREPVKDPDPTGGNCGGQPCDGGLAEPFCGDGIINGSEACDDGNISPNDGCSPLCEQAPDFVCVEGELCVSTVVCGDRRLSTGEGCDDGNTDPADGCDASCQIEMGWVCPIVGLRCSAAMCGDGVIAGLEECEDGAAVAGDGCDATCQEEPGYGCTTVALMSPPSMCAPTVCNNGMVEGDEPCDDGNQILGDGCTTLCEVEPNCPVTGPCTSSCGDGLILPPDNEECDDGNTLDGDGCSSTCTIEDGYECELTTAELPASIDIPFVFRDFVAFPIMPVAPATAPPVQRHPDFQNGCLGSVLEGMVAADLDEDGKPLNTEFYSLPGAPACVPLVGYVDPTDQCANLDGCDPGQSNAARSTHPNHPLDWDTDMRDPFYYWYRDQAEVNKTKVEPVTLTRGAGDVYTFSSGAFFPWDGDGWVAAGMELPYNGGTNNFGFTSEVRRWFLFNGGETLTFTGDDDLFVFVNGKLALEIGSKHGATSRTITLNADGTATCPDCTNMSRTLGLEVGNVYEIVIFHAERQASASNFTLGLGGFVSSKTECSPVCGDGIVTPDEQCDNGEANEDGLHGGCSTTCILGPYCGDGTTNGPEQCDLGPANVSTYGAQGCAPGCLAPPRCGDGIVQSDREECDLGDGMNLGGYEGCEANCQFGPFCGDGTRDEPKEQCDDGNLRPGDGCSPLCKNQIF